MAVAADAALNFAGALAQSVDAVYFGGDGLRDGGEIDQAVEEQRRTRLALREPLCADLGFFVGLQKRELQAVGALIRVVEELLHIRAPKVFFLERDGQGSRSEIFPNAGHSTGHGGQQML